MRKIFIISAILSSAFCITINAGAQTPAIYPTQTFVTDEGEIETTDTTGSAPMHGYFRANPEDADGYTANYEWRFYEPSSPDDPWLIRYSEDTDYEFTKTGTTYIVCYATFVLNEDTVEYTDEYWEENEPLKVTITESSLSMPNAFSPNGDGINDIYRAKEGYSSLVEFKAVIFNRWGQKLYEWTDPADGWDGTYHGHDVKQGVYFVVVKAKGADGVKYNIRRDVNLLRGYNEEGSSSTTE